MFGDENGDESFEDTLRSIARELGRSVEHAMDGVDIDDVAGKLGVDPDAARGWVQNMSSWVRAQAEGAGEEVARRVSGQGRATAGEDALRGAAPHPLDLPSEEQGRALAALDSGRWTVEPGSDAFAATGDGPEPAGALGVVRELRARDWIAADGGITLAGHHALRRWLEAATRA